MLTEFLFLGELKLKIVLVVSLQTAKQVAESEGQKRSS